MQELVGWTSSKTSPWCYHDHALAQNAVTLKRVAHTRVRNSQSSLPASRTFLGRREQTGDTSLGLSVQTGVFSPPALFVYRSQNRGTKNKGSKLSASRLSSARKKRVNQRSGTRVKVLQGLHKDASHCVSTLVSLTCPIFMPEEQKTSNQ